jgi:SAM-dependent methyltransferase
MRGIPVSNENQRLIRMEFVRSLPKKESTAKLHTTKYAIRMFNKFNCRKILDVGCGNAYFEETFPDRFIGIDIEKNRVKAAKERGLNNILLSNATNLAFKCDTFDGVLAKDILEHLYLEQAFKLISEVMRVLKPGGIFIVVTTKNTQSFWDKPDHIRPYSNKWVERVCTKELGAFELVDKKDFSAGIPGFGRLRLEGFAHFLADKLKIHSDHGVMTLKLKNRETIDKMKVTS